MRLHWCVSQIDTETTWHPTREEALAEETRRTEQIRSTRPISQQHRPVPVVAWYHTTGVQE